MENKDRVLLGGKIYKSYIKTILGKVYVTVWNSFENRPEGLILYGDPRNHEDECIVDVLSEDEDYFFRNKNKRHLQTGDIITYTRSTEEKERTPEEYSDDELKDVISKPFFSIQKLLNDTESVALLFRVKNLAQELDKSDKVMKAIEARIAEVQKKEFSSVPDKIVTEL